MTKTFFRLSVSLSLLALLAGCEKVTNTAKNIQSDWVGLERTVELRSCFDGKLIKAYHGDVRLNPEDRYGTSLLINGKKLHTNMCYIIHEKGLEERALIRGATQ